ncbi:MAG: YqaA family protein [Alphaproteobacteria bacterium]
MKNFLLKPFLFWKRISSFFYHTAMELSAKSKAVFVMMGVAFFGSFVFPIPADPFLMPMVLAEPKKAWRLAGLCTLASVLGGLCGYGIGLFFYDSIGIKLLNFYGYMDKFEGFKALYHEWGALIVMASGITPFPYKVVTITSGVVNLDIGVFLMASVVSRGIRFFTVAGLLWKFGSPIKSVIEKNMGLVATAFLVLLIGGFALIGLL